MPDFRFRHSHVGNQGSGIDALGDNKLFGTRCLIDEILGKRDQDHKAKAIGAAKSMLAAAGLTLKD